MTVKTTVTTRSNPNNGTRNAPACHAQGQTPVDTNNTDPLIQDTAAAEIQLYNWKSHHGLRHKRAHTLALHPGASP
eukprot:CAMPEP_0174361418 /NCGR_PEP_ID=MMETSP0811_2-20130205/59131_1 /TAXON_ID=73025 ORGANISM="Eutreptiella gymnastica-like, Strain CCMP1594" /NCGR_SAMPLE_ID=MMETSP0811_2 /ASSEMBLY_ACC=CAM_ASM_000667 /LENGTH=75 /DNA_ID=CAMNT_0015498041 /DNA_START=176 /DNA_END=400 /DNA_ORIENTATION=-